MKRLTWFVTGLAAGATGASYATRKVKRKAAELAPVNAVRIAAGRARGAGRRLVEAAQEGRSAMRDKEDELRARRDRRIETIDEHLDDGDRVFVDGRPVEPGRVIVLKPEQRRRG